MLPGLPSPMISPLRNPFTAFFKDDFNRANDGDMSPYYPGSENGLMRVYNQTLTSYSSGGTVSGATYTTGLAKTSKSYAAATMLSAGNSDVTKNGLRLFAGQYGMAGVNLAVNGTTWTLNGFRTDINTNANNAAATATGPSGTRKCFLWFDGAQTFKGGYFDSNGVLVTVLSVTTAAVLPATCYGGMIGGSAGTYSYYFDDFEFGTHSL